MGWNDGPHVRMTEDVVGEIDQTLGEPATANERRDVDGRHFRQRRWTFSAGQLSAVAAWFDQLSDALKTQEVVAQSSTFWGFAWRDESSPLPPMESAGGMFGIHLGRRHRVTTMFLFRDLAQYASIKAALSELKLVELSDKHLRPKVGPAADTRSAK